MGPLCKWHTPKGCRSFLQKYHVGLACNWQLQRDEHAKNTLSVRGRNIEIIATELVKGEWKHNYRFFVCFRDWFCSFSFVNFSIIGCVLTDVEDGFVIFFLKKI